MALYKFFKPSKPSETLATEQNNLNKRENEILIDELQSVEEIKENDKSIACFRKPRLVSMLKITVTHPLLEPWV